jgi:molybdate transport system substrate-binding protein
MGEEAHRVISVLCTLGLRSVLVDIADAFGRGTGLSFSAHYQSSIALMDRIANGESADVAILTDVMIAALIEQGRIREDSRCDLASSGVGLAVRAGTPKPDISTPEGVKHTLLAARSIAYTATGASGLYFAELIERLGIGEAIRAKATIRDGLSGELAARGEVEIAVQQVSELMQVAGIDVIGPLPPALQKATVFSTGILSTAKNPAGAASLIGWLSTPATARVISSKGLQPLQA